MIAFIYTVFSLIWIGIWKTVGLSDTGIIFCQIIATGVFIILEKKQ